jgi:dihydrodipicolinate synthase/N-acetylneuraminate lyase
MKTQKPAKEHSGELQRREFLQLLSTGALGLALAGAGCASAPGTTPRAAAGPRSGPKPLRGLFPIGSTPYTEDDKLDLESLAGQVTFCNRGGVHGFVWPQIASGWTALNEPERIAGAEAIIAAGKGGATALVIGVQSKTGNMQEVERYAKHAAKIGADAIVSLPPPGVTDEKVLLDYYQQVGKMTDLPLIVQTQGTMSVDLVVDIYKTVRTARNVKDEASAGGGALQRIPEIRRRTNDQMLVFSGQGVRTMINEMELGFSGHCPVVSLADVYASAFDLWHEGKRREAFDMFGRILAFNSMGSTGRDSLMIVRGIYKHPVHSRNAPAAAGVEFTPEAGAGGGRGGRGGGAGGGPGGGGPGGGPGSPHLDDKEVREALDNYLKPYLRA